MPKYWVVTSLINFLIAALLGLVLRYAFISEIDFNFRFLTHAHSHIAMLGWLYLMLYSFIVYRYLPKIRKIYHYLFFVTQSAVIGMLFSFPFQGYAAFSIVFSSLHIFASYFFVKLILKDLKPFTTIDKKFIRAALWFMVISTIGIWCLPISIVVFGKNSDAYNIAIQTFLHFQFNGWFIFGMIGLFINYLTNHPIEKNQPLKKALGWLILSVVFTLALPISWFIKLPALNILNSVGVIFQLIGFYHLIIALKKPLSTFLSSATLYIKSLVYFILISMVIKVLFQSFSVFPEVNEASIQIRNLVIGFIHLLMLGVASGALLLFLSLEGVFNHNKWIARIGLGLFISGFVLSEFYLFLQGGMYYLNMGELPLYHKSLLVFSAFIGGGVFLFLLSVLLLKIKKLS
ncbi:MAG: hypothetical protein RQ875_06045 [Vicingaceae bacterium]|nr:hypothetical protein [Vicingaceae bacterium]